MDVPVVVAVAAPDDVAFRHRLARRAVGLVEALRDAPGTVPVGADSVDHECADTDVRHGGRELDVVAFTLDRECRDVRERGHREVRKRWRDGGRKRVGERRRPERPGEARREGGQRKDDEKRDHDTSRHALRLSAASAGL